MKILLIGKNGQLGQELDRQAKPEFETFSFGKNELDISNEKDVRNRIIELEPDVVINASAYHVLADCEKHPDMAFEINTSAVLNLARACAEKQIRLVNFSTDYVFDGEKGSPYEEDDKPNPLQVYGVSKLAGEYMSLIYNPKTLVVRTCGVYGGYNGSHAKKGNFVLNILKASEGKSKIEISSEQVVSPTYSVDLAKATLELIRKIGDYGVYHLVNEGYCSWAEFAQEIFSVAGKNIEVISVDRSGQDASGLRRPLFSALKNKKAKRSGIKLPSWEDALKRYISFLASKNE